jgi:hypothetical protein
MDSSYHLLLTCKFLDSINSYIGHSKKDILISKYYQVRDEHTFNSRFFCCTLHKYLFYFKFYKIIDDDMKYQLILLLVFL